MTTVLDETIAAAGYAKVIVTLKPQALAAAGAGAAVRMDGGVAQTAFENNFIVASQSQNQMLAAASLHAFKARKGASPHIPAFGSIRALDWPPNLSMPEVPKRWPITPTWPTC